MSEVQAVKNLLQRCASPSITFHEVPEGPHELFLGSESEIVTEYVLDWIQGQVEGEIGQDLSSSPMKKAYSIVSLTGDPFEWTARGLSPLGSVYGK